RRFSSEPSSRLLLTAQGHDALDNLQQEVEKIHALSGQDEALIVRSVRERRRRNASQNSDALLEEFEFDDSADNQDQGPKDVARTVAEMLRSLSKSELATG